MKLIYSPTENGYYWQRRDWKVSRLFRSRDAAERALAAGRLRWK